MKTMKDFKGTIGNFKMDINHQTHVTGAITICVGSPETGDGWAKVGEASKQSTYVEVEANARLFANSKKVLSEAILYLPILKMIEEHHPDIWDYATKGTGIATTNGLEKAINDSL